MNSLSQFELPPFAPPLKCGFNSDYFPIVTGYLNQLTQWSRSSLQHQSKDANPLCLFKILLKFPVLFLLLNIPKHH